MYSTMSASRPTVSSPLAGPSSSSSGPASTRMTPQRTYSFPPSRALRPFPTTSSAGSAPKKPVKMIQPPANQRETFVLNLTQAEFSRQQ